MTLSFEAEWQQSPGIRDAVDRAAWARLVIRLPEEDLVLTRCIDQQTQDARDGVYGSVFPLARWLVQSYWNLLYEIPRVPRARSGRELASYPRSLPWLRRHNLLAAREGYSLPDLTVARDGEYIVVSAFPDGSKSRTRRPVRFMHQGIHRVEVGAVDAAITSFVGAVIERLHEVDHPDVAALREDWDAVLRSKEEEADLCISAARMGLDPYDEDEMSLEVERFLLGEVGELPADLQTDVLDATNSLDEARGMISWLSESSHDPVACSRTPPSGGPGRLGPAHQTGYWAARAVRKELGLGATEDISVVGHLARSYGFPVETTRTTAAPPPSVDGLLAPQGHGPRIIGPPLPHADKAFRWSRGLYMWRFGHAQRSARIISRSQARLQRESRAFAAELLAPAQALRRSLTSEVVDDDEIAKLADKFTVRPQLIRHQIENHRLAIVD